MKRDSRANHVAFRRAVWASVALHVGVAGVLVLLLWATAEQPHAQQGIDTHAEPQVRISLSEEAPIRVEEPPTALPATPQAAGSETPQVTSPEASPTLPAKPFALVVPQLLPAEMLVLIRKPAAMPAGPPHPPQRDPNVQPASAPGTRTAPAGTARGVPAMHGALAPGKTVVYLLDSSGSMGAGGKFDAARSALISTLRQQPATVRFQVIVYAGTANPLLTSDPSGLAANEANVRAAAEKLAALEPRGQSDHFGAVRAALRFRPDVILLLSDGDDISPVLVKRVVASAGRTVPVCLGRVTDQGVQRPYELK